ncbi:autotransporter-associated beta strand repeat-containing protein, partial [Xanthobacter sediminis]
IGTGTVSVSNDGNLGAAGAGIAIAGGTLAVTGSFTSSRAVTLSGAGTLSVGEGRVWQLAGPIGGGGSLTKGGTGMLVLLGDSTQAGGITIAAGALQVGDGGTSGSLAADVVNLGALVFNRSDTLAFNGAISGSGSVTQLGTGRLVL